MNKKFLFLAAFGLLAATACKKSDGNFSSGPSGNSWTLDGTSYTARMVSFQIGIFTAVDVPGNTCSVKFGGTNVVAGTYKVVMDAVDQGEVSIIAAKNGGDGYYSAGDDNKIATVTVNNGKPTVSVPAIAVVRIGSSDRTTFSGNFTAN